jgi:hypothetical protein
MIIGEINIYDDEDKRKPITETIGFNPSRRNIIRNQNFNMNIMTEKKKEDVDKLTYHYLELSEAPLEEKTHDINSITTKYSKMKEMYTTNNFYNSLLCPEEPYEINAPKKNIAYDGGTFLTDKISLSSHQFKKTGEIEKEKEKENIEENKEKENIVISDNIENPNNNTNNNTNNNINTNTNTNTNNNLTNRNESVKEEIYSAGFESIPELNHSIPISFDKLIVNLVDEPGKPKPINPLFFIINGEKIRDKSKFINFRTNPSLFTSTTKKGKKSDKNLEEFFNKNKKNITDGFNTSKTPKFLPCFNKACENKPKLNYDLKKTIFNDPFTHTEDKYKILKDLQRNELMNRALGRGIFSCNKYYEDEKRALSIQKRKKFEQMFENSKDKMVINLRTKEDFFDEKKKFFPESQNIIAHNYLRLARDEPKKREGFKEIEKFRSEEMRKKVENLYHPKPREKIKKEMMSDTKMDKLLKNAHFEYSKPYSYLASGIVLQNNNINFFDNHK